MTQADFIQAIETRCQELKGLSTGPCPGCSDCADSLGFDSVEEFDLAYEIGKVESETHFSWAACGICGSSLGGDREPWHYVNDSNEVCHEQGACVDCMLFLANGDLPTED